MDPILDAIDEALKQKRLSDAAASKLAVGNYALIKNMRSSRSDEKRYNFHALQRLADVLGLECYFGPPRGQEPTQVVVLDDEEFAPIPRFDARLSAGPGTQNGEAEVLEKLAFRRDWLARLGVSPSNAALVSIAGDSMAPGLQDGDLALIDRNRRDPRSGHVYALVDTDGSTRVKRIDLMPNGLILRSDAPSYPAEFRSPDEANALKIVGQVVWSGHTW